jgi:hypothetical protein
MPATQRKPIDDSLVPTLRDLMRGKSVVTWHQVKDRLGNIVGCAPYGNEGKNTLRAYGFIDIQAFADMDHRFTRSIRKMYDISNGKPVQHFVFVCTSLFLRSSCTVFTKDAFVDAATITQDHYAMSLSDIDLMEGGNLEVSYVNAMVVGDSLSGQYVSSMYRASRRIKKTWLDLHYPGWLDRYHIGDAIGMKPEQLANMVLPTTAAVEAVALPEMLVLNRA